MLSDGPRLTDRQRQVAELVAAGYTDKVIARRLGITPCTVRAHIFKLARKFRVAGDRDSRVMIARRILSPYSDAA